MTIKKSIIPAFLIAISLLSLFSCGNSNSKKSASHIDSLAISTPPLTIDTFSTFPPEVEGCSCYFSNNPKEYKEDHYIYMNDFTETSFLKINGVLTKFTQTEFKNIDKETTIAKFKNNRYELVIEVKDGAQTGYETSSKTGTIKLTDEKGRTVTTSFYGVCGC